MSQHKRTKREFPLTAVLAVILLFAGLAAIAGSLWMQENEIATGAEEYTELAQELKVPATPEDAPEVTTTEEQPVADDLPDVEVPAAPEVPSEKQPDGNSADFSAEQPAVTVVPPLTVKPIEQEPADSQPSKISPPKASLSPAQQKLALLPASPAQTLPPAKQRTAISPHGFRFPVRTLTILLC